jgi:hypothetical protein
MKMELNFDRNGVLQMPDATTLAALSPNEQTRFEAVRVEHQHVEDAQVAIAADQDAIAAAVVKLDGAEKALARFAKPRAQAELENWRANTSRRDARQ